MTIYRLDDLMPTLAPDSWVADEATLIGDVRLGAQASVWPGAVIRADNTHITIGARSNIQEGAVLHVDPGYPITLGEGVTVGHQAMLHGCSVGAGSLVGIQAVILNGAVIGEDSLVGAGALVTEGKVFPPRSLILGSPARAVRTLEEADLARLRRGAEVYVAKAGRMATRLVAVSAAQCRAADGG
ncbi:MAG: hypothetical protein RLY78_2366 [Pseudomonadota bacterium]|jgi:carbonic anhydrase/acetyltransferase-like protein (isoleucine patch superfamily)|uniref:Gamma carbonic anhydrase family protein n=1 Tax=Pseudaquabacterium rugosum TaxID=2984194 RepID=A0ABU9BFB3_9BURK